MVLGVCLKEEKIRSKYEILNIEMEMGFWCCSSVCGHAEMYVNCIQITTDKNAL